jgi:hypothetical protein
MGSFLFNPPLGARINWSHPINRGLVGCWLMNEGGGQVYRNLAGNRGATDGVGIGNPVPVMSPYGRAMFFDGATQYVDMGSSIPFDSDNWSMALWFYQPGGEGPNKRYFSYYGDGPTLWQGGTTLQIVHSGVADFNTNILQLTKQWHHVVVARAGPAIRAYENGNLTASNDSFTVIFSATNGPVHLGHSNAFNEYGLCGMVRPMLYNRALSQQEAQLLYVQPFVGLNSGRSFGLNSLPSSAPSALHRRTLGQRTGSRAA